MTNWWPDFNWNGVSNSCIGFLVMLHRTSALGHGGPVRFVVAGTEPIVPCGADGGRARRGHLGRFWRAARIPTVGRMNPHRLRRSPVAGRTMNQPPEPAAVGGPMSIGPQKMMRTSKAFNSVTAPVRRYGRWLDGRRRQSDRGTSYRYAGKEVSEAAGRVTPFVGQPGLTALQPTAAGVVVSQPVAGRSGDGALRHPSTSDAADESGVRREGDADLARGFSAAAYRRARPTSAGSRRWSAAPGTLFV
jgi:hypothetical protein